MPYESLNELPESVQDNLPKHAQEVYMAAYNITVPGRNIKIQKIGREALPERRLHKVAWNAVKKTYEKKNGKWKSKDD